MILLMEKSAYRPARYPHSLQSAKMKTHWFLLHLGFPLSSATYSVDTFQMWCGDSPRSSCVVIGVCHHRDFTLCVKPDGQVCLQHHLVAAPPLYLPCAIQMFPRWLADRSTDFLLCNPSLGLQSCALSSTQTSPSHFNNRHNTLYLPIALLTNTMG